MKLIYIAAPYSAPTPEGIEENIKRAADLGAWVAQEDCVPVVPHLMTRGMSADATEGFWRAATMEIMKRCDGVLALVEPYSAGVDHEVTVAESNRMQIFHLNEFDNRGDNGQLAGWLWRLDTEDDECTIDVGHDPSGTHVWLRPEDVRGYCTGLREQINDMRDQINQAKG